MIRPVHRTKRRHPAVDCLHLGMLVMLVCLSARIVCGQVPTDSLLNSLHPSADVNDYAGILTSEQKATLEERCKQLRSQSGAQLAVVTVKSLDGGQIDDFANKLFSRWGIGEQGKNNGLLLLVAMEDRKARVEVGYGLEPVLPDAFAGRILDQDLFPAFKQKRYFDGLQAAVNHLCEVVERGEPATAAERRGDREMALGEKLIMTGFLSLFVAAGSFIVGAALRKRIVPQIFFGSIYAGLPLLIGYMAVGLLAPIVLLPVGLLMVILGWRVAPGLMSGSRGSSSPNWTWTDSSGSSGGSGGGGFSSDWGGFGGGSSGGGGASGGW